MERLSRDYLGESGDFFKKQADESLERAKSKFILEDSTNTPMWGNKNPIPGDILELLELTNHITTQQRLNGDSYRQRQHDEWFKNYKPRELTGEEKFEMNANFPKGTKIVNVLTGKVVHITE